MLVPTPTERDPNGMSAHDPGAKLDAGKRRMGLVMLGFARALKEVGDVGTYGARKYSDNGWQEVPNGIERYTDALLRHLIDEGHGLKYDPDTQLLHAAHVAWNALARLDLIIREVQGPTIRESESLPMRRDTCSVPVDRVGDPVVTTEMKVAALGEFTLKVQRISEDGGSEEYEYFPIPWTTCKEIYKTMVIAGRTAINSTDTSRG